MKMDKKKITDALANIGIRAVSAPAGAILASVADKIAFIGNLNPYIKGGAKILLGAIIPEIHNKPNDKASVALAAFGAGFAAVGGLDIAKSALPAIVSGVGSANILSGLVVDTDYKMSGQEEEKVGSSNIVGKV